MRNHVLVCLALLTGAATGLAQTRNAKLVDLRMSDSTPSSVVVTPTGYPIHVPGAGGSVALTVDLDGMRYTGFVHHSGRVRYADFVVGDFIIAQLDLHDVVVISPAGKRVKLRIFRRERLPAASAATPADAPAI